MEEVIQEVYEPNFGTGYETYKDAIKKDSSIRLQGVKDYLAKRDDIQVKTKPSNSSVSPGAKFELETDIMDILARGGVGIRYGMAAIDNFTKVAEVIPIKNRQPTKLISALQSICQSMGKPKQLYSSEEPSFRAKMFFRFINENVIKQTQTSTHAPSAERFIRTFKDNVYRRLCGLKQHKKDCVKHVDNSKACR